MFRAFLYIEILRASRLDCQLKADNKPSQRFFEPLRRRQHRFIGNRRYFSPKPGEAFLSNGGKCKISQYGSELTAVQWYPNFLAHIYFIRILDDLKVRLENPWILRSIVIIALR